MIYLTAHHLLATYLLMTVCLYRPIYSVDDSHILQDLLRIEKWADKWMMIFNTDKCEVLHKLL